MTGQGTEDGGVEWVAIRGDSASISDDGVGIAGGGRFGVAKGRGGGVIEIDAADDFFDPRFDLLASVLVNVRARRRPIFESDESSDYRRSSSLEKATGAGSRIERNVFDMISK